MSERLANWRVGRLFQVVHGTQIGFKVPETPADLYDPAKQYTAKYVYLFDLDALVPMTGGMNVLGQSIHHNTKVEEVRVPVYPLIGMLDDETPVLCAKLPDGTYMVTDVVPIRSYQVAADRVRVLSQQNAEKVARIRSEVTIILKLIEEGLEKALAGVVLVKKLLSGQE